jgi:endonuclease YncB( thermonuclease family)
MNLLKKLNLNLFKFLILIFFILCNSAYSEIKFISSNVEKVIVTDGDSLKIGKEKIRLSGIDAPEMKQICYDHNDTPYACGHLAKTHLEDIIKNHDYYKKIYCYYSERDKYKRILGECMFGETSRQNINEIMVLSGHAVAYLRYSEKYIEQQETAKKLNYGLWAGKFDMPEEWRKKNK